MKKILMTITICFAVFAAQAHHHHSGFWGGFTGGLLGGLFAPRPTYVAPAPVIASPTVVPATTVVPVTPTVVTTTTVPTYTYGYYNNYYCPTYCGYYWYNDAWVWGGGFGYRPPVPRWIPPRSHFWGGAYHYAPMRPIHHHHGGHHRR